MTKRKTIQEKIEDLNSEASLAEAGAIAEIEAIVEAVEEKTGRKFDWLDAPVKLHRPTDTVRSATVATVDGYRELPLPYSPLGAWVRECARIISTTDTWSFESPCDFLNWAETAFTKGWVD